MLTYVIHIHIHIHTHIYIYALRIAYRVSPIANCALPIGCLSACETWTLSLSCLAIVAANHQRRIRAASAPVAALAGTAIGHRPRLGAAAGHCLL